jgi:xanthine/CO dehydrogenase XdhC/CoxF family maturation factor
LRLAVVFTLVLVAGLAGCGGSAQPDRVVREWSDAINAGDYERAASLFAKDAVVIQGSSATTLHTPEEASTWNRGLPCGGTILLLEERGSTATATFRMVDRKDRKCDAPAEAEATALFVVDGGKIILWNQIESHLAMAH